jgi:hypothetical protein
MPELQTGCSTTLKEARVPLHARADTVPDTSGRTIEQRFT